MPFIELKTNIKIDEPVKSELVKLLGQEIKILHKSEDWLMINIIDNQNMYFKGSNDPCLIGEVKVYGDISSCDASKFTESLTKIVSQKINIPASRIYFNYFSTPDWGYSGFNF